VTFSDERVIERVNRDFVGVWKNIRPSQPFGDGDFLGMDAAQFAKQLPNGTAPQNVTTFFCTSEGEVLHALPGYWKSDEFAQELSFISDLAARPAEGRGRAHADRAARLGTGDPRRGTHQALSIKTDRKIDEFLANTEAGLR